MFVYDFKDFRDGSECPITITEDAVVAALTEAGVSFDEAPLSVRVRVKYMRPDRFLPSKFDTIDEAATEFRLNVYTPPFATSLSDEFYEIVNKSVRHQFAHIAQTRKHPQGVPPDTETMVEYEKEAQEFAENGTCTIIEKPVLA